MTGTQIPLQHHLDNLIQQGIPGLSVVAADSQGIVWQGVAGLADIGRGLALGPGHLLGIGSITKTFVAVVVLQLQEEGRLTLGQTAGDFLAADLVANVPGAQQATLAQLLNHTSGIPSWEDDPDWIRQGRGEQLALARYWQKTDTLAYIKHTPALHPPGEAYAYANTNHTILGLVIEAVTGNDLVTEFQRRIMAPLGLKDIYLEGFQPLPVERLARRYHYGTAGFVRDAGIHQDFNVVRPGLIDVSGSNLSVEWAAGGLVASAADLARYAVAFRNGALLSTASMAIVQDWLPVNDTTAIGHGLFRRETPLGVFVGHEGAVLGYTAVMRWAEATDLAIVALANVGTMHTGEACCSATSLAANLDFIKQLLEHQQELRHA